MLPLPGHSTEVCSGLVVRKCEVDGKQDTHNDQKP